MLAGLPAVGYAQLCSGSLGDPVVKIDFGAGSTVHAPALPEGTTFDFAAWAANLIRTTDVSPPDLTFTILKMDGVSVLATVNTGTIPVTRYNQYIYE